MATTALPKEDAVVLQRYAIWNPQAKKPGILCYPCSHCNPPDMDAKRVTLRYLHGECHCTPCGSCAINIDIRKS